MKKIICILILLSTLLSMVSCSEPQTYISDDLTYIVQNGVKYVKVETPIIFFVDQWANKLGVGYWEIIYTAERNVFYYSVAKRYPFEFFEQRFAISDVLLSNGITVKYLNYFTQIIETYCLESQLQTVKDLFANFSWASDIVATKDFYRKELFQTVFSKELSEKLISLYNEYHDMEGCIYAEYENSEIENLCILDENKDFYKLIFARPRFLADGRVVLVPLKCRFTKTLEKADCTLEDFPEELILSAEEGAEIIAAHEALAEYNKKQNNE